MQSDDVDGSDQLIVMILLALMTMMIEIIHTDHIISLWGVFQIQSRLFFSFTAVL